MTDEQLLDADNWKSEAQAVINDIKEHVKEAFVSNGNDQQIFINLTTIENDKFCIELTGSGFRVVGKSYDEKVIDSEEYFETPYSLLNKISPLFRNSFGNALLNKLNSLNDENK